MPGPATVNLPLLVITPPRVSVAALATAIVEFALKLISLASVALTLFDNMPPFIVTSPVPKAVLLSATRMPALLVVPPV